MTIRLYRSTDPSAPQLSTTDGGSLINILRGCLVDGYGSRTPQGWTMPFSDLPNKKAVFRGVSGTGDFLWVNDNYNYVWAEAYGYGDMTDVDTGTGRYPEPLSVELGTNNIWKLYKRASTHQNYNNWMLIASDEYFYFFGYDVGQLDPSTWFFGEYNCISTSFTAKYAISGYPAPSTETSPWGQSYAGLMGTNRMWLRRSEWDDSDYPFPVKREIAEVDYSQPNPLDGKLYFEEVRIRGDFQAPYTYFGTMPGLYRLMTVDDGTFISGRTFTVGTKKLIIASRSNEVFGIEYDVDQG